MFHGTLITRIYCNRPQLTVQQMVSEAGLFTFYILSLHFVTEHMAVTSML